MTQSRPGGSTGTRGRNSRSTASRSTSSRSAASRSTAARSSAARPRQGVASRELQAARRKRRQREVMRNRILFGIGCLAVLSLLVFLIIKLIGFVMNSGSIADNSTLTFDKSGKVVFEEVTDFDTDIYSKSELRDYTKELIDGFNDTYGEKAITLDKIKISGDKAYIKTTYKDADAYSSFTSYQTFNGSYEDAEAAGFDFEELFCPVADSTKGEAQAVIAGDIFADYQIAIVNENVNTVVPGQINYISETSTEIVDDNTVSIKQADGNEDAADTVYIIYTIDK